MAFPPTYPVGIRVLPGYPNQLGEKMEIVFDRTGPASYTQFSTSLGTGGDVLQAASGGLGMGGFDNIDDTADNTGQFEAIVVLPLAGFGNAVPSATIKYISLVTATLGGKAQTANTEVVAGTNLSGFSFRYYAVCI
jgi:hypothetical protein